MRREAITTTTQYRDIALAIMVPGTIVVTLFYGLCQLVFN